MGMQLMLICLSELAIGLALPDRLRSHSALLGKHLKADSLDLTDTWSLGNLVDHWA